MDNHVISYYHRGRAPEINHEYNYYLGSFLVKLVDQMIRFFRNDHINSRNERDLDR